MGNVFIIKCVIAMLNARKDISGAMFSKKAPPATPSPSLAVFLFFSFRKKKILKDLQNRKGLTTKLLEGMGLLS